MPPLRWGAAHDPKMPLHRGPARWSGPIYFKTSIVGSFAPTGQTVSLEVESNYTVYRIKEMLQELEGVPIDQSRLMFAGKSMGENTGTLDQYGVPREAYLHHFVARTSPSATFAYADYPYYTPDPYQQAWYARHGPWLFALQKSTHLCCVAPVAASSAVAACQSTTNSTGTTLATTAPFGTVDGTTGATAAETELVALGADSASTGPNDGAMAVGAVAYRAGPVVNVGPPMIGVNFREDHVALSLPAVAALAGLRMDMGIASDRETQSPTSTRVLHELMAFL